MPHNTSLHCTVTVDKYGGGDSQLHNLFRLIVRSFTDIMHAKHDEDDESGVQADVRRHFGVALKQS